MTAKAIFTPENKKFLKNIFYLAGPIILHDFLNSMVNILDSLMIGRLGPDEINAVGFSNELFFLYILFIFGISSGSSIFMGQFWGKRDVNSIHKVMGICFCISFILSALFACTAFFVPEKFISFYSAKPEVIALGAQYLRIIAATYLLTGVTVTFNAALRCIGQTKIPMMTTLVTLLINGILNYIFIFVFHWGVQGAALATAVARASELIAQIFIIFKFKLPVAAKISGYFGMSGKFVKNICISIVPVFLNEAVWAVGVTLYKVAYKAAGDDAQAAVQIAAPIQNLFMVMGIGIGAGCGILIANTLGVEDREKAIQYSRKCLKMAAFVSAVMGLCFIISAPMILINYNVSNEIKADTFKIMCIIAFIMMFKTVNYTAIVGILRNGGDTKFCLMLDAVSVWFIGVPAAFLGAYVFKLPIYIIVAMVNGEELFKFVFSLWRVLSNKWANCIV